MSNWRITLENLFFNVMGISGWIFVAFVILSSMTSLPTDYGHKLLYVEWAMVGGIWLISRWGHKVQELITKFR